MSHLIRDAIKFGRKTLRKTHQFLGAIWINKTHFKNRAIQSLPIFQHTRREQRLEKPHIAFTSPTPSGISVAPIQNWSRNQAIDALEALCDALQSALKADYQYYIAKKRGTRIARHVDALEAWARVKSGVSAFSVAADKHPALLFIATQIATLLVYRLYGRTDGDVQINHIWDMAHSVPETNEDNARVAEIVKTVVCHALYMRDDRLEIPDISDLLIE